MRIKRMQFVDAQVMRLLHPKTFSAPTIQELEKLKVGDYAKVCPDVEDSDRFWAIIQEINGESIVAKINNDLVCTDSHGLYCDDLIRF